MGSLAECLLLARNPLKLPGRFWDCVEPLLMTADGWKGEWLLTGLPTSAARFRITVRCRTNRNFR